MSSPTVLARKGKLTRKFTQTQWDLMGKNKHGWEIVSSQTVSPEIAVKGEQQPKPKSGEKNIAVESDVAKFERLVEQACRKMEAGDLTDAMLDIQSALIFNPQSKVANGAFDQIKKRLDAKLDSEEEEVETGKTGTGKTKTESPVITTGTEAGSGKTDADKEKFIEEHLADFSKTEIKNYFDGVKKKYNQKAGLPELKLMLAEHVEFDVEKLKAILE